MSEVIEPVFAPQPGMSLNGLTVEEVRRLYTTRGEFATSLMIVFTPEDLTLETYLFKPELVHQVYGENSCIYGYKNPQIKIFVMANSCKTYMNFQYDEMIPSDSYYPKADNFMAKLNEWLPDGCTRTKDSFLKIIKKEDLTKMYGTVLETFEAYITLHGTSNYIVTHCTVEEPGFIQFHERFQCYSVWFIDAASQIDITDPNWLFLYIYEERVKDGKMIKTPIGYCSIYKFFHYPDKIRTRISQILILPVWQRRGLGSRLLQIVYEFAKRLPNVSDITVEDPCTEFINMRDALDCKLLKQLNSFKLPNIKGPLTKEMYEEANAFIKMSKQQCRHVYEILRSIECNNEEEKVQLWQEIECRYKNPIKSRIKKWKLDESECFTHWEDAKLQLAEHIRALEKTAARISPKVKN